MKMQNYLQSPLSKVYRPQKKSNLTSKITKTFGLILFGAACFYAGTKYDSIVNSFKSEDSIKKIIKCSILLIFEQILKRQKIDKKDNSSTSR